MCESAFYLRERACFVYENAAPISRSLCNVWASTLAMETYSNSDVLRTYV